VYDLAKHFEFEAQRSVEELSTMKRAAGGAAGLPGVSPVVILARALQEAERPGAAPAPQDGNGSSSEARWLQLPSPFLSLLFPPTWQAARQGTKGAVAVVFALKLVYGYGATGPRSAHLPQHFYMPLRQAARAAGRGAGAPHRFRAAAGAHGGAPRDGTGVRV